MGLRTFQGAVCVVTGGASGIGKAFARDLVGRGARVIVADRQDDVIERVVGELGGAGKAEAAVVDVRDEGAVDRLVGGVFERHGRLDFLFNNAGIGVGGEAKDYDMTDWKDVLDVNLYGVIHGVQAAYPRMIRQGFGHIVNTASAAGLVPTPYTLSYATSKHAVVGLSRSLRIEAREFGVRVSVVCPGVIQTPLLTDAGRYGRFKVSAPADVQAATWKRLRPMNADAFASRVVADVGRNRAVIIHPRSWRAAVWLDRLFPAVSEAIGYRVFIRMRDEMARAAAPRAPLP